MLNTSNTWKILQREGCSRWMVTVSVEFSFIQSCLSIRLASTQVLMIQPALLFNPKLTDTNSCVIIMGYNRYSRNIPIFDYSFWKKADCLRMIHFWTGFTPRMASTWKSRSARMLCKHWYNKTVDIHFKIIISFSKTNWIQDWTCMVKDHPSDFTYN